MPDTYAMSEISDTAPAVHGQNVTPSDETEFDTPCRAFYIGGAGTLHLLLMDGSELTFEGIYGGSILPIRAWKVFATGTTATNIVALW